MKARPRLLHGVLAAAGLAFLASVLVAVLTAAPGFAGVARLLAPVLSLAYLLYLFRIIGARNGRLVTLSAWAVLSICTWWMAPALPFYLLIHAGAIWLIRSLYAYSSLIPALIDLALSTVAVATFTWALMRTGSIFLATWSFFLVQALWTCIPKKFSGQRGGTSRDHGSAGFERARRQADAALRQLFTQ